LASLFSVAIAGCAFVEDLAGAFDVRMIGVARSKENALGWRMMQQVLPLRLQGILFTNPPPGVGVLWAIVVRFLSPKLRKRVRMGRRSGRVEALPQHVGGRDGGAVGLRPILWRPRTLLSGPALGVPHGPHDGGC